MENSRFYRNDNLAPFFDSSKQKKLNVERSAFDYGRSHSFQLKFGAINVADCFPTLPNSNYKLSCNLNAIFRNPTVRKLINNCRLFVEYFYCREGDLWEGAHNTITKGRSGNINKEYPSLIFKSLPNSNSKDDMYGGFFAFDTPDSLLDDFGLPCCSEHIYRPIPDGLVPKPDADEQPFSPINSGLPIAYPRAFQFNANYKKISYESNDNLYINALPFFMYQKIWRDFYLNKNLAYNNKNILPDNEEHFIIPYEQDSILFLDYNKSNAMQQWSTITQDNVYDYFNDVNMSDPDTPLLLAQKRYRQYRGDYFTTAFPFPEGIRGNVPTIELSSDNTDLSINIPNLTLYGYDHEGQPLETTYITNPGEAYAHVENDPTSYLIKVNNIDMKGYYPTGDGGSAHKVIGVRGQTITTPLPSLTSSITLNDIRQLEAFTKFQERMARTDGDYSEMITSQFGSKTVKTSRQPVYIGGFYQDILVNSVYQTSQSSADSPLGRQSGIGVSTGEHYIGDFFSDDYGYIMAVISCIPEVYYNTGVDRMFSVRSQTDKYFPLMNELPPQPILNKELFVSGIKDTDEDVFAYSERFSEYKSRRNLITGKGRFYEPFVHASQPISEYDNARVIIRKFESAPNFNNDFVQATDVDMSPYSVRDEMPLDVDFGSKVTAVLPMPYVTIPGGYDEN